MTGETMKQLVGCPWNSSAWHFHLWGDFMRLAALPSDSLLLLFLINVSRISSGVHDSCKSRRTLPQAHFLVEGLLDSSKTLFFVVKDFFLMYHF